LQRKTGGKRTKNTEIFRLVPSLLLLLLWMKIAQTVFQEKQKKWILAVYQTTEIDIMLLIFSTTKKHDYLSAGHSIQRR
jgi:hypothetical protein